MPGDTGFCLVIQDLRGHSAAVLASPFVQALRQSQGVPAADLAKLEDLDLIKCCSAPRRASAAWRSASW